MKCCATILNSGTYLGGRCTRAGTIEEGGKPYCKQHAPSNIAAKRAVRDAKWDAEWAATNANRARLSKINSARDAVVDAVRAATEQRGSWDDVAQAMDDLRHAEGDA